MKRQKNPNTKPTIENVLINANVEAVMIIIPNIVGAVKYATIVPNRVNHHINSRPPSAEKRNLGNILRPLEWNTFNNQHSDNKSKSEHACPHYEFITKVWIFKFIPSFHGRTETLSML